MFHVGSVFESGTAVLFPKLLAYEQKQHHLDNSSELVTAIHRYSCAKLDVAATKDEVWSAPALLTQ
jgi:hypothetical protein